MHTVIIYDFIIGSFNRTTEPQQLLDGWKVFTYKRHSKINNAVKEMIINYPWAKN